MAATKTNNGCFKKGEKRPNQGGRKQAKTTIALKEAILLAASTVGKDAKGGGGLTGYLMSLAVSQPAVFGGLLGKVLPLQITGPNGGPQEHKWTVEVVVASGNIDKA